MILCGTVVICLLKIINDSGNDMAVISISHLNKDILVLASEPCSWGSLGRLSCCLFAVANVNWSVVAGQTLGQWGPKFFGFSQLSLRPGILITVLRAVWRNLFSFSGGFTFLSFLWVFRLHIYCIYIRVAT